MIYQKLKQLLERIRKQSYEIDNELALEIENFLTCKSNIQKSARVSHKKRELGTVNSFSNKSNHAYVLFDNVKYHCYGDLVPLHVLTKG